MPASGLHFVYLPMHNMMGIILLCFAQLHECVSITFQDGTHMPHLFPILFTVQNRILCIGQTVLLYFLVFSLVTLFVVH